MCTFCWLSSCVHIWLTFVFEIKLILTLSYVKYHAFCDRCLKIYLFVNFTPASYVIITSELLCVKDEYKPNFHNLSFTILTANHTSKKWKYYSLSTFPTKKCMNLDKRIRILMIKWFCLQNIKWKLKIHCVLCLS